MVGVGEGVGGTLIPWLQETLQRKLRQGPRPRGPRTQVGSSGPEDKTEAQGQAGSGVGHPGLNPVLPLSS